MSLGTEISPQSARAALDAARVVFAPGTAASAPALWQAAQQVLQRVLGRPELTGHALVGEARRIGVLTLSDAHALVGLSSWADRSEAPAADEAERLLVRESWMALEHAVPDVALLAGPGAAPPWPHTAPPSPPAGARTASAEPVADEVVAPRRRVSPAVLAGIAAVVVAGVAGGLWYYAGRADRLYRDGVDAYQRGAREVARAAFVQMAQQHPDDARPLIYLGRITREEGDLARSRRFLTTAVRLAPGSAIAARELAGVMLADGQPEIARRFYVRAIELDPTDRTAQGFLGCALARLQRLDEARRWIDRAGPGDWQRCLPPQPSLPPGAMPPAVPPGVPPS
jgi:tetratricopeptide (TPR) repeat protein